MYSKLNELDFKLSLEYISARIGIELPQTNYSILREYLSDKLKQKSVDVSTYFKMMNSDENEYNKFVDTVTINETYFFREEKHFSLLNDLIFPELNNKQKPLNIWSAACSSGEEAISLFLSAEKFFKDTLSFKIYGSDVNMEVLEHFQRGVYRENSFREDGSKFHNLVKDISTVQDKSFRINPELIKKIHRQNLNISCFDRNIFTQLFDLIFLRNTLIYFSFEKRKKIIDSIVDVLKPGGFLFLSATEMPLISHSELELAESKGTFYFQKKARRERIEQLGITESIFNTVKNEKIPEADITPENNSGKFDADLILEYAADKLNNRIFTLVSNPDYDMAVKLIRIIFRINNNEIEQAVLLLNNFEVCAGKNPLTLYLRGYTLFIQNKKEQAADFFSKTLMMDSFFWPAGFYLALILIERKSDNAKKSLLKCINSIEEYIRKDSYKYQIFLEGFNGKYFLRICKQWLKKI